MCTTRPVFPLLLPVAFAAGACLAILGPGAGQARPGGAGATPGGWVHPAPGADAEPVWASTGGLGIGLWPMQGPRGLLRVYAPHLGQQRPRMVNFISIEPIVDGRRGQSELELGAQSGRRGLAIYTGNTPGEAMAAARSGEPARAAAGTVTRVHGAEALEFYLTTERFRNGARPLIQVLLRRDRPREAAFRLYAAEDSARMQACVLSATMGNYSRLRHLWLRGEVVDSRQVWPEFNADPLGFAPWRQWDRQRLFRTHGDLLVAATPDETDPAAARYDADVPGSWRYQGQPATQYWRTRDRRGTVARVNGRVTYWGGSHRIPGGVSFENFELQAPFSAGQELRFGVSPEPPETLGFDAAWESRLTDGRREAVPAPR